MRARSPARRLLPVLLAGLVLLVWWLVRHPGERPAAEPPAAPGVADENSSVAAAESGPDLIDFGGAWPADHDREPPAARIDAGADRKGESEATGEETEPPTEVPNGRFLVGAVIAPSAEPLRGASFEIVPGTDYSMGLGMRRGSTGPHPFELAEGGAFRIRVTESAPFEAILFRAQTTAGEDLEAYALLPDELPEGDTDLGHLTLAPPAPLVAGRVVDGAGQGIPDAMVHVHWKRYGTPRPDAYSEPPPFSYHMVEDADRRTADDGTFVIDVHSPGDELRLSVQHPGFLETVVECMRGAQNVDLVLRRAAGLRGTVLADPWVPLEKLSISVEQDAWNTRKQPVTPDDDGSFGWDALDPGRTVLHVTCEDMAEPLLELSDLELVEGQVLEDPRLNPLDLRGALMQVELRVLGEEGQPLPDARAIPLGHRLEQRTYSAPGGVVTVLGRTPGLDLHVYAPGYRAVDLLDVREERTVTLSRGIAIEIELDLREPLEEGEGLLVLLEDDGGPYPILLDEAVFRADHTATLHASYPGPHRLSLWLTSGRGVRARLSGAGVEAQITVSEASDGQRVPLACDGTALQGTRNSRWWR